jgi:hypothetical protein
MRERQNGQPAQMAVNVFAETDRIERRHGMRG